MSYCHVLVLVLVSVFMAAQLAAHLSASAGIDWPRHVPQSVLVAAMLWHYFALGFGFIVLLPLGIVCGWKWLARRRARQAG